MPAFPNLIEPLNDEYFLSYILRLVKANGFDDLHHMPDDMFSGRSPLANSAYNANWVYYDFARNMPPSSSLLQFYMDHSTYPYDSIFMTESRQTHLIHNVFRSNYWHRSLNTPSSSSVKEVRICRECVADDLREHGFFYLRRSHQLPGVTVCQVHGSRLLVSKGNADTVLDTSSYSRSENVVPEAGEIKYAVFAKNLLDSGINTNGKALCRAVFEKLSDLKFSAENDYLSVEEAIWKAGLTKLFPSNVGRFVKRSLISPNYINAQECTALLLFLFGSAEELKKALGKQKSVYTGIPWDENEYEIVSHFSYGAAEFRHKRCGTEFVETPWGFSAGWKCPECDRTSDAEMIDELVSQAGGGTYTAERPCSFSGMDSPLRIRHTCGNILRIKPRSFLEDGVRCECETTISFSKAQSRVSDLGPFELVEYSGTGDPAIILHKSCGREFSAAVFQNFTRHPFCPLCNSRSARTAASFRQEVRDLVGDDYTVVTDYSDKDTKVRIRHEKCGTEQDYLPRHFLSGQRCRECTREITDEAFKELVLRLSFGLYTVDRRPSHNSYVVRNRQNSKIITLSKARTLQELTRPTPSSLLPGVYEEFRKREQTDVAEAAKQKKTGQKKTEQKKTEQRKTETEIERKAGAARALEIKTNSDRILEFVHEHCDENGLIFSPDIKPEDCPREQIRARLTGLVNKEKLFHPFPGVYSIYDREYDSEELIEAKYIIRYGKRIGFYSHWTFALENGIVSSGPYTLYVTSNYVSAKNRGTPTASFERSIRTFGMSTEIREDNYRLLQVLNIIDVSFHYGWDYKEKLRRFSEDNHLSEKDFDSYLNLYPERVADGLHEMFRG